jgi:hypothetical protein
MKEDVKIYNIKAFIRKNLSGELDMEKCCRLPKRLPILPAARQP